MVTCFNTIGKRIGLVHIWDVVLVQKILCEYVKRDLAMVKVWFINMVCVLYIFIHVVVGFLVLGKTNHVVA